MLAGRHSEARTVLAVRSRLRTAARCVLSACSVFRRNAGMTATSRLFLPFDRRCVECRIHHRDGSDYVHARLLIPPFFAVCSRCRRPSGQTASYLDRAPWRWCARCHCARLTPVRGRTRHLSVSMNGNVSPLSISAPGVETPVVPGLGSRSVCRSGSDDPIDVTPAPDIRVRTIASSWIGAGPYIGTGVNFLDLGLADPLPRISRSHIEV